MIFDRNENKDVIALLGAGAMGCAIVRRIAAGRKILFGDISEAALERVSDEFDIQSEVGKFTKVTCTFNLNKQPEGGAA